MFSRYIFIGFLVGSTLLVPKDADARNFFDFVCNVIGRNGNAAKFKHSLAQHQKQAGFRYKKSASLSRIHSNAEFRIDNQKDLYPLIDELSSLADPNWRLQDIEVGLLAIARFVEDTELIFMPIKNLSRIASALASDEFLTLALPFIKPSYYAAVVESVDARRNKELEIQQTTKGKSIFLTQFDAFAANLPPKSSLLRRIRELASYSRRAPVFLKKGQIKDARLISQTENKWGLRLHASVVSDKIKVTNDKDLAFFCGNCTQVQHTP